MPQNPFCCHCVGSDSIAGHGGRINACAEKSRVVLWETPPAELVPRLGRFMRQTNWFGFWFPCPHALLVPIDRGEHAQKA